MSSSWLILKKSQNWLNTETLKVSSKDDSSEKLFQNVQFKIKWCLSIKFNIIR